MKNFIKVSKFKKWDDSMAFKVKSLYDHKRVLFWLLFPILLILDLILWPIRRIADKINRGN